MGDQVMTSLELPGVKKVSSGKVREMFEVGNNLLIVTTDRVSAFDCVLPQGIPGKGRILTKMSLFWYKILSGLVNNHLITANVDEYAPELQPFRQQLEGRSMLVKKCRMEPIECVPRGYIVGSGWKDYKATGSVCGIRLRPGLQECSRLDEPIFTPSTKAETGHDKNISFEQVADIIGPVTANRLAELTLRIYSFAAEYAKCKGIILADTKFEFGWYNKELLLCDEVLTPDSSRFWLVNDYEPGRPQKSFDKQFVRDYLESLSWNKQPPAPELPDEIIERTAEKYHEAYFRLTGQHA